MKVVVISGSPRKNSNTHIMMKYVFNYLKSKNDETKFVDLSDERIDYYRGPDKEYSEITKQIASDLTQADVWLVGTPIYNSFFSSALKNLFEYINYKDTPGKVAGLAIMASGSISFTQVQSLLTQMMSYFRIITNPKSVHMTTDMITDGKMSDQNAKERLEELVSETLQLATKLG
jgi:NAD(P)H-dependent FMN reductase